MTSRDQIQFSADIIFLKESELKKLIVELNSQSYNNFNTSESVINLNTWKIQELQQRIIDLPILKNEKQSRDDMEGVNRFMRSQKEKQKQQEEDEKK